MHLVQIQNVTRRRVAVVREPDLVLLRDVDSSLALAERAISEKRRLSELATSLTTDETLSYDSIFDGKSDWKLLPPIDCPGDSHRVHVSGTGLTHLGSARDRQAMHVAAIAQEQAQMTDRLCSHVRKLRSKRLEGICDFSTALSELIAPANGFEGSGVISAYRC